MDWTWTHRPPVLAPPQFVTHMRTQCSDRPYRTLPQPHRDNRHIRHFYCQNIRKLQQIIPLFKRRKYNLWPIHYSTPHQTEIICLRIFTPASWKIFSISASVPGVFGAKIERCLIIYSFIMTKSLILCIYQWKVY